MKPILSNLQEINHQLQSDLRSKKKEEIKEGVTLLKLYNTLLLGTALKITDENHNLLFDQVDSVLDGNIELYDLRVNSLVLKILIREHGINTHIIDHISFSLDILHHYAKDQTLNN